MLINPLLLAFITGLTTGGLSCLAVQGGLLTGSLAQQLENDLKNRPASGKNTAAHFRPTVARPILLFLIAKIIAYTLLGALLGALGSVFSINPLAQGLLQLAVGIFMVGSALRIFNVHPIFRYFIFEPPAGVTRFIRRYARTNSSDIAPLFLGAFTILIPCGITQIMLVSAVGTGNALMGAATMAAFTLGTSPVFFAVAYFATQLGARLEKYFMRAVAATLLILGLYAIDAGLNLTGSPFSFTRVVQAGLGTHSAPAATLTPENTEIVNSEAPTTPPSTTGEPVVLQLNVKNYGYEPSTLHAPADVPIQLNLVTADTRSCSRAFVIPSLNVQELLPQMGTVSVEIPAQPKGTVIPFSCSMGMYTGEIIFE